VKLNEGITSGIFANSNPILANNGRKEPLVVATNQGVPATAQPGGTATATIQSPPAGADIELDGGFAGSAPAALQLPAGTHQTVVKHRTQLWEHKLQVSAGSSISLNALFSPPATRAAR
jgi:hypothetical protein